MNENHRHADQGLITQERPDLIDLTAFEAAAAGPGDSAANSGTSPSAPRNVSPLVTLAGVGALAALTISSGGYRVLLVVVAFATMILLHEFGHFITARLTGMKTTEFFLGFGPRLWSFRRGEMEYGVKALPLGGYVKILGMNNLDRLDDPADEPRTFRQATFPRRVLVASAGTLMHLLIAFVLFATLFSGTGKLIDTDNVQIKHIEATLGGQPSPAASVGLRLGDRIYAINGVRIVDQTGVLAAVRPHPGEALRFDIVRNNKLVSLAIVPAAVNDGTGLTVGRIGVESSSLQVVTVPWTKGLPQAGSQIVKLVPYTFKALGAFFAPKHLKSYGTSLVNAGGPAAGTSGAAATQDTSRFLSPKGAVDLLADASRVDIRWAIELFATINVFVGIFNMLPVLPLDGGHVLMAIYERVRSRRGRRYRVDVAKMLPLTYAVVAIMLAIGISSLYLDIRNPLKVF